MAVRIAEYFGQRTDVDFPIIKPIEEQHDCPFAIGNICKKLKSGHPPVCSVRRQDGTLWIVCSERLCSTKKNLTLNNHQVAILLDIGKHIYSDNITVADICVKREERLNVVENTKYNADYIISLKEGHTPYSGPDKLILEMQGGGETTNTGNITALVHTWENNPSRNNAMLRNVADAGTLETNAWRRQQEQFIVKGNIAMKTWKGYGIAFCVGSILFDYLKNKLSSAKLPDLHDYNWTLALIGICENDTLPIIAGPIPIKVDNSRLLYTNYQTFVQALINQGEPSLDAFRGDFVNLENQVIHIE
jgi:hypothetical protein